MLDFWNEDSDFADAVWELVWEPEDDKKDE